MPGFLWATSILAVKRSSGIHSFRGQLVFLNQFKLFIQRLVKFNVMYSHITQNQLIAISILFDKSWHNLTYKFGRTLTRDLTFGPTFEGYRTVNRQNLILQFKNIIARTSVFPELCIVLIIKQATISVEIPNFIKCQIRLHVSAFLKIMFIRSGFFFPIRNSGIMTLL